MTKNNFSLKNPFFSVVIPAYKSGSFIKTCVDSVINQTFPDFEIIIIIDPPFDNEIEILEQIVDERLTVIKNKSRVGLSESRNIGWNIAKGKYIAFLDSDDVWFSEKLEYQKTIIDRFDPDLFSCENTYSKFYIDSVNVKSERVRKITLFRQLIKNRIHTSNAVVKSNIQIRFSKELKFIEDYPLWTTIVSKKYRCFYSNIVVSYYYEETNKNGLSSDFKKNYVYGIKPGLKLLFKTKAINCFQYIFVSIIAWIKYLLRRITKKKLFANKKQQ